MIENNNLHVLEEKSLYSSGLDKSRLAGIKNSGSSDNMAEVVKSRKYESSNSHFLNAINKELRRFAGQCARGSSNSEQFGSGNPWLKNRCVLHHGIMRTGQSVRVQPWWVTLGGTK